MLGFAEPVLAGLPINITDVDTDVDLGAKLAGAAFGIGENVDAVPVGFTLVAFGRWLEGTERPARVI